MRVVEVKQNGVLLRGKEREKGEIVRMLEGDTLDVLEMEGLVETIERTDEDLLSLMDE